MDEIGTHLFICFEFPPYIFLSLCFLEYKQATARNILRGIKPVTNMLYRDTIVKQAGDQYIRL